MNKTISFFFCIFVCIALSIVAIPRGWEVKKSLLRDRNHPAVRAFLDTIAYAEGTYHERLQGYHMRYPAGTMFESFEAHPALVATAYCSGREIRSTAAGRYMFLAKTWNTVAERLDLHDFSPLNQDLAAIYLIRERKALDDLKNGDIRTALEKINTIWASLPGSPHQQPVKKYAELRDIFSARYNHYKKYLYERGMQ